MVTLASLLDHPELDLVPLVDGRRVDTVRWVAASELEDPAPFLEGGEILLTTGLEATGWNSKAWDGYVRRLGRVGVVAIGFGVGLTHDAAPEALIRASQRHGIDLFEVPRATPFVTVSRAVARLLHEEEESATRVALDAQRALTVAALDPEGPPAILAALGRATAVAAVVSVDGSTLVGPTGPRPDLFDPTGVAAAIEQMRPAGLRAAASLGAADGNLAIHPIGVRGTPDRYLVTGSAGRITDVQRSVVTTAVALLSLAEERRRASRDSDRRLRDRAIQFLIGDDPRTAEVLLTSSAGRAPRLPAKRAFLRARGSDSAREAALDVLEVDGVLAGAPESAASDELVIVVGRRAAASVAAQLEDLDLMVGVADAFEHAGYALAQASTLAPVVHWSDAVRKGVVSILEPHRAEAFGSEFLAPLEDAGEPELAVTLDSYLRHHGSRLQVAQELGIHRNTVRHRIDRIEQLLGRSLADPQTRVDAWIALQVAGARGAGTHL